MSVDRLSNMVSSIKNASMAMKKSIELPYSKECETLAKILKENGYIEKVKTFKLTGKSYKGIHLDFDYDKNKYVRGALRVSKPGRRVYKKYTGFAKSNIPGFYIVSTSRGIMTSDEARKKKLGGEVICLIY